MDVRAPLDTGRCHPVDLRLGVDVSGVIPGAVEIVPEDLVSRGRVLIVDGREGTTDDVGRLLPGRNVEYRAFGAGCELSGVGLSARFEFRRLAFLVGGPIDELVHIFALLVVLEDLRRQQTRRLLPGVLVDDVTRLEVGGARRGDGRGEGECEHYPPESTHGR